MCIKLKNQRRVNPSVADRDITVMKIGYVNDDGSLFHPLYMNHFTYTMNEQAPDEELRIDIGEAWRMDGEKMVLIPVKTVSAGYHAYIDPAKATDCTLWMESRHLRRECGPTFGEFTIPAGAKYFIGDDGDIVASAMTYIGELSLIPGDPLEAKTKEVLEKMKKENKSLR